MKGIVFNLLEEVVSQEHGEATWDDLLDAADLDGAYTALGNYADDELLALVGAASEKLGMSAEHVVRWFAVHALPLLGEKYSAFFTPHSSTIPFLLTLNDVIHPEVRKLYPGADVPTFKFEELSPDELAIVYRSPRKLCSFAEGLIEGAATWYGENVTIEQSTCMNRGDASCRLVCRFVRASRP